MVCSDMLLDEDYSYLLASQIEKTIIIMKHLTKLTFETEYSEFHINTISMCYAWFYQF